MADQVIDRALKIAKERHGWNQPEFAQRIGAEKQHITNWKKRGMPPARHAKVAEVLGISVDELLGKKPRQQVITTQQVKEPTVMAYNIQVSRAAMLFAAEFEKLTPALQSQLQSMVHTMVAELVRQDRVKKPVKGRAEPRHPYAET